MPNQYLIVTGRYEGYGPGSVAVIVEALTDNRHRTGPAIRHLLSKHGGSLQSEGSVSWMFERCGRVEVPLRAENGEVDREDLFNAALEAGASDITFPEEEQEAEGEEDSHAASVVCEATSLAEVRDTLTASGFPPTLCELVWQPKSEDNFVSPMGEDSEKFSDLLAALEDNEDVQQVHHNASVPE
uniref:TACO1/YebC-like second and third domain-containing protein n=1 Tax=Rhizochromulina marina TaxID=1034831 RepID=A0A7S2REE8_9STRA|mmetsp:Transcript_14544/g.42952  ORF Transcript_14544/g.42952 Transcript_14544/m.42952 type:complete len:185 (+) Transcript_14544:505-1059(+)